MNVLSTLLFVYVRSFHFNYCSIRELYIHSGPFPRVETAAVLLLLIYRTLKKMFGLLGIPQLHVLYVFCLVLFT